MVFRFLILCAAAFALCVPSFPQNSSRVLEIDGKRFTLAELEALRPALLFEAQNKFYESQRAAIEKFIGEYLLEQQAKKEGVTVAELLDRRVNISKDPSEEALRVYYEGVETTQPFEAIRAQILQSVRERRKMRAKDDYLKSLRANAKIGIYLDQPRLDFNLSNVPVRGPKDAPIVLVEYADYECPYCQQIVPVIDRVLKEFPGKVAFTYRDAPLPMHPRAQKAAEAARCAGEQGKFWEYHDRLYATRRLDPADLKSAAAELRLDTKVFDACLDSGKTAEAVKKQLTEFETLSLPGTPTFFLNGRMISGADFDRFQALIGEELAITAAMKK